MYADMWIKTWIDIYNMNEYIKNIFKFSNKLLLVANTLITYVCKKKKIILNMHVNDYCF